MKCRRGEIHLEILTSVKKYNSQINADSTNIKIYAVRIAHHNHRRIKFLLWKTLQRAFWKAFSWYSRSIATNFHNHYYQCFLTSFRPRGSNAQKFIFFFYITLERPLKGQMKNSTISCGFPFIQSFACKTRHKCLTKICQKKINQWTERKK